MIKISKTSKKTLVLALLAGASFVYSAIYHFDIDPAVMLSFFKLSVALVCVAIVFGVFGAVLIRLLRR